MSKRSTLIPLVFSCLAAAGPVSSGDFRVLPWPSEKRFPEYIYLFPNQHVTWQSGVINWKYNPARQPAGLSSDQAVKILRVAQAKWEQVCGIRFDYQGITSAGAAGDGTNVVTWDALPVNQMGLTTSYSDGTSAYLDTDVQLDPAKIGNAAYLEAIATHEFGHALGLNHSDTEASIMFANPYHTAGYQMILRDDDISGCRALYGASSSVRAPLAVNQYFDRLLNYAEDIAPAHLQPRQQGGTRYYSNENIPYRYYVNTDSYLAIYQGYVYFAGRESGYQWLNQGSVEYWLPYAANAGYF